MEVTTHNNKDRDPRWLIIRAAIILKKHRKLIFLAALFAFLAASISTLNKEPTFVSSAQVTLPAATMDMSTIIPGNVMGDEQSSALKGMVGAFFSACLLPAILGSRTISENVLESTYSYSIEGENISSDLYRYLQTGNRDAAIFKLRSRIAGFYLDPATNITTIKVATTSPELSYEIVKAYISSVEEALYELKLSTIRNNLDYMDMKLLETNKELHAAEESLKKLRIKNRDYEIIRDPSFYLEQIRLEREIKIHEQMAKTLRSYYELTMSKLLDKGGKLYVVTEPFIPSSFTYPEVKKNLITSLVIAILIAAAVVSILVIAENTRREQIEKWTGLAREIRNDWRFMFAGLHLSAGVRRISALINSITSD